MTRFVRAEILKLRTAPRTALGIALALLAVVGLGAAGTIDAALSVDQRSDQLVRDVLEVAGAATAFALVLGILIVTWEYRHGTIAQTFLAAPRRERVVAAKLLVAGAVGLLLAALAVALGFTIMEIWVGDRVQIGDAWEQAARLLAAAALWGALGVAYGSLVASQVGALVSALVWLLIGEPLIGFGLGELASIEIGKYLPSSAAGGFVSPSEDTLSAAFAGLVTAGYLALAVVLGTIATLRRDVT